jgi:aryl-alcohol dehydrogenase-like predicted oxidoreductase
MRKVTLSRTDLQVSGPGLGTDYFGSQIDRAVSIQLMDHYFEAGGNLIDTAEVYARWIPGGDHKSEQVVGQWLRERQVRDQIVVSTKGAHPNLESMQVPRMSKSEIEADLDSSLQRLGVDHVDIYWLHRDAPGYPIGDILESLEALRAAGKIRYYGFSNWPQPRAEEARLIAAKTNIPGFVASQNLWSLGKVNIANADATWAYIDEPFAQWHQQNNFAAFPYMTQASGYFRRMESNTLDQLPQDARVRLLFDHEENRQRFRRAVELQKRDGLTLNQVALGYLIGHPFPVIPLVGPKSVADLDDSLKSAETALSAADIAYLESGR